MYCDPLAAEGLFPLAEDDAKRLRPDLSSDDLADVTERDLPYEYKRDVDYFAKFDAMLPAWRLFQKFQDIKGVDAALTMPGDPNTPNEVKINRRQTRTLAHRRYVRAIAPDGTLRQLKISTVRPTPAFPDGLDACSTHTRFISRKRPRGWIVVEGHPDYEELWCPYVRLRGQEYAAWALAVMEYRRKRHAAYEAAEAETHMNTALRESRKQTEALRQMGTEMGREIAKALRDRDEQPRTRREKAADPA